jgi:hypothetical protein
MIAMDYNSTVEWLKKYKDDYDKCIYIRNAMTGLKAISYTEKLGKKKTINEYMEDLIKLNNEMADIEETINSINDPKCRLVIAYRYLQFKKYDEIGSIMGYSERQIKRFHKNGINFIKDVTKCH